MESREKTISFLNAMADEYFDAETYYNSETYEIIKKQQIPRDYPHDSQENLKYWESLGLKKEVHHAEDIIRHWFSFVPVNAEKEGKPLPLLFVMHGHNNTLSMAETYGYTHLAAEKGFIVVMSKDEHVDVIDEMYEYATEHFPVDKSRVYMAGYSFGGFMTAWHTLRNPKRFAAAGIGGMMAAGDAHEARDFDDTDCIIPYSLPAITKEQFAYAAELTMPVMFMAGEREILRIIPICERSDALVYHSERHKGAIDLSTENKVRSLNIWRQVNGLKQISLEEMTNLCEKEEDEVVKKLGYCFDETEIIVRENRHHYMGTLFDKSGQPMIRMGGIEGAPHWPTRALCELTWEFISQFRRDQETGKVSR